MQPCEAIKNKLSEMYFAKRLPPIGMRIIKSAFGVAGCFMIYLIRGRQGMPFYSAIAVLWCIQSHTKNSFSNAAQRVVGTAVGAAFGLIFILCKTYIADFGYGVIHYIVLSAFIIPVIYVTDTSYFSCVVYLSIVVNHLSDENPFIFVWDRSLDTLIGIGAGLFINGISIHKTRNQETLFAVSFDNSMRSAEGHLTPYARVTLQNLIEDGIKLAIVTSRTPATYLETMGDIRPSMPIIAMDGAILYDIAENSYPHVYVISADHSARLEDFFRKEGVHAFTTVIIDDVLLIYYGEFHNEAEKKIFEQLHRSPYRNYLNKPRPAMHPVVYFMLIEKTERIQELKSQLDKEIETWNLKISMYPSDDHKGYSYMKIYNENAGIDNMLDYLKERSKLKKVVTINKDNNWKRAEGNDYDSDRAVRRLRKLYYS